MRQIVLDTETTGLEHKQGHRIIEIGCVELINRRLTGNHYHQYLRPERDIDEGAMQVHGITNEFLADKPLFADVVQDFMAYIDSAELIIHNAPFDVGFINKELMHYDKAHPTIDSQCKIVDTLALARHKHPGQKNNLDAMCKRYEVDNTQRQLHGALLDAQILADVYLCMTGGQSNLSLGDIPDVVDITTEKVSRVSEDRPPLLVIKASNQELEAHQKRLVGIDKTSEGGCVWLRGNE